MKEEEKEEGEEEEEGFKAMKEVDAGRAMKGMCYDGGLTLGATARRRGGGGVEREREGGGV